MAPFPSLTKGKGSLGNKTGAAAPALLSSPMPSMHQRCFSPPSPMLNIVISPSNFSNLLMSLSSFRPPQLSIAFFCLFASPAALLQCSGAVQICMASTCCSDVAMLQCCKCRSAGSYNPAGLAHANPCNKGEPRGMPRLLPR
eukprot:1155358-Pelagomonas_calceolata.AAC.5